MAASRWSSFAVSSEGEFDGLLLDCLGTAADEAVAQGTISAWSLRRDHPGLTLTVRDLRSPGVGFLTSSVPGELRLRPVPYRAPGPEFGVPSPPDRDDEPGGTGGTGEPGGRDELADAAEQLACAASQVALAVLRSVTTQGGRRGAAFALLVASARAVSAHSGQEVRLLRSRRGHRAVLRAARERAELELCRGRERYEKIMIGARRAVPPSDANADADSAGADSSGDGENYLGFWAQELRRYRDLLTSTDGVQRREIPAVLLAHVHALCGLIGLDRDDIAALSWLASLVIAGADPGADFHAPGLDTPARRYHERSKFFAPTMTAQLPRTEPPNQPVTTRAPGRQGAARNRDAGAELRPLPPADPALLARPALADCLRLRRSCRGDYGETVSPEALATLLGLSLRARGDEDPATATEEGPQRRSYPSPGSCFPGRVLLYPPGVPGLPRALYEYLPERHALRVLRSAVDSADEELLLASSPYLVPEMPLSVRGHTVPVWLFLVSDIERLTRRYGLRAYRFLLMEIGHLAQNLVLTATGLGLRSLTIGSFYDDQLSQFLGLDGTNTAPFYLLPVGSAEPAPR